MRKFAVKTHVMDYIITDIFQIDAVAAEFVKQIGDRRIFAFYGEMGAGKTTFVKAVCQQLGVEDVVNSPTFAIVNEYDSARLDCPIYHFDFYRIRRLEEAYDIGVDDYFYGGGLCFIEWPELIEPLLPDETVRVDIRVGEGGVREIAVQ